MPPSIAAIVVFGAPLRADGSPGPTLARRLDAAFEAARRWPDAPIIVSGGAVRTELPEAVAMRADLLARGVAAHRLVMEDQARRTLDTVRLIRVALDTLGAHRSVVVVTSAFHAPRCRVLLRAAGIEVAGLVVPGGERLAMGLRAWVVACAREAVAVPWCLLRLWQKRRTGE